MKIYLLLFLIFSTPLYAQEEAKDLARLKIEKENKLRNAAESLENDFNFLQKEEKNFLNAKKSRDHLVDVIENHEKYTTQVLAEADKELKNLSVFKKISSNEANFLKCVKNYIEVKGMLSVGNCKNNFNPNFNASSWERINKWSELVYEMSPGNLKISLENSNTRLKSLQESMDLAKKSHKVSQGLNEEIEETYKIEVENIKLLAQSKHFLSCDKNTPDIDLESEVPYKDAKFKGPFAGVPRDNQDGVGTCFANVAKNLLVGLSAGKDVASFLDLALLSKKNLADTGLDAGLSCDVLKQMKEKGSYCPQELSPIETGSKNIYTDSLLGENPTLSDHAQLIDLVRDYVGSKENLEKRNQQFANNLQSKGRDIITAIKSKDGIPTPGNQIRELISRGNLLALYSGLEGSPIRGSQNEFVVEYEDNYARFYPLYLKAIINGQNQEDIFNLFTENLKDFITKYNLGPKLPKLKKGFLAGDGLVYADEKLNQLAYSDPKFKKIVNNSLDFLNRLGDEKNQIHCNQYTGDEFKFLNSVEKIVVFLDSKKIDAKNLYDKEGKFKSPHDLMQLIVAPGCVDESKRKKIDFDIHCSELDMKFVKSSSLEKIFRDKVIVSLLNGIPIGNVFEKHVNTIVGMRFNSSTQKCEYKIRESQTGDSSWQQESKLLDKVERLVEVRKK